MKLTIALAATLSTFTTAARYDFTFDGECNYTALKTSAENTNVSPEKLISLLTYGGDDEVEAEAMTEILCEMARAKNSNPRRGAFDFGDINDKGWQFDNNYFDGGTYLNEEYEPTAIEDTFNEVYENIAKDTLVTFPNDATSVEKNFADCDINAIMCCWVQDRQANDDNGNCNDGDCVDKDPADNTDICYVDLENGAKSSHVAGGYAIFPGDTEGDSHCHGMAWGDDLTGVDARYRGNSLFYISMYDHLSQRGYVREVPGAPMCGCIDQMPVVTRADCTEMNINESYKVTLKDSGRMFAQITDTTIEFNACRDADGNAGGNDLENYLRYLNNEGIYNIDEATIRKYLVGSTECPAAIEAFLNSKGLTSQQE